MPEMKSFTGGCHCGRVRYDVTTDLAMVAACNCSICQKRGALWTFVGADQFKLHSGDDLTDYQFAKKIIHHMFCPTCGVGSFSRGTSPKDGREMVAVNVRCLDDVDIAALQPTPIDGRSL
jgi:hypothetical protein